jgi:hypothetical protein
VVLEGVRNGNEGLDRQEELSKLLIEEKAKEGKARPAVRLAVET